jgi:hypothetical protein
MVLFQGLFFLIFGLLLVILDIRALRNDSVPFWSYGFGDRKKFSKIDQPLRFWAVFTLYGIGGFWMLVFALRLFVGKSLPLPLK